MVTNEVKLDLQKDKATFNQLLNSPLKRYILGIYILIVKRVMQNTNFDPQFFKDLIKLAGTNQILTREQIVNENTSSMKQETLELLFSYKLLFAIKNDSSMFIGQDLDSWLQSADKFRILSGIEFDENKFERPSAGLALSLGVIVELLQNWLETKFSQIKVQKALEELHTVPSRVNPHILYYIMIPTEPSSFSGSKKKSTMMYSIFDPVIEFLDHYHPEKNKESSLLTGELFLDLIETSIKLDSYNSKITEIDKKTHELLSLLNHDMLNKHIVKLAEKIICRELMIINLTYLITEHSRYEIFEQKLRNITDQGTIAKEIAREIDLTNENLPDIFKTIDEANVIALSAHSDLLVVYSRLVTAYLLSQTIKQVIMKAESLFTPKIGDNVMNELYQWMQIPKNRETLNQVSNLIIEAQLLCNFYSKSYLEELKKTYYDI